jgi:hypothetical protein
VTETVLRVRPRRIRVVAWSAAVAIVVLFTFVASALRGPTGEGTAVFQPGDQVAMIGLGLLAAAGVLLLTRPRVEADAHSIKIKNVIGGYDLPWQIVRDVRFDRGAAWVTLELEDDDVISVLAVQRVDREHALAAVRALRALHAAAHPAPPPPTPPILQ